VEALGTSQGLGTFLRTLDHLNKDMGQVVLGTPEGAGTFLTWDLLSRGVMWWPWGHLKGLGPSWGPGTSSAGMGCGGLGDTKGPGTFLRT